jgi:hypothetical protein
MEMAREGQNLAMQQALAMLDPERLFLGLRPRDPNGTG